MALRTGLVRDKLHAENILGVQLGIFAGAGYFDAAALAATASVNLRFDDAMGRPR